MERTIEEIKEFLAFSNEMNITLAKFSSDIDNFYGVELNKYNSDDADKDSYKNKQNSELEIDRLEELRRKLRDERIEILKSIIGNSYDGVAIEGVLTFRGGRAYYRGQSQPDLWYIKQNIMKNLHEFSDKIKKYNPQNLNVIENVLTYISEKDAYYNNYWTRKEENKYEDETILLGKTIILPDYTNRDSLKIDMKQINYVRINEGEVKWGFKEDENYTEISVSFKEHKILGRLYKDIIESRLQVILEKRKKEIESLNNELNEIKRIGQDILLLAQIQGNNKN